MDRTPLSGADPALHLFLGSSRWSGERVMVSAIVMATAPSSMVDVVHHVELGDRAPELRIDHLLEGLI